MPKLFWIAVPVCIPDRTAPKYHVEYFPVYRNLYSCLDNIQTSLCRVHFSYLQDAWLPVDVQRFQRRSWRIFPDTILTAEMSHTFDQYLHQGFWEHKLFWEKPLSSRPRKIEHNAVCNASFFVFVLNFFRSAPVDMALKSTLGLSVIPISCSACLTVASVESNSWSESSNSKISFVLSVLCF